ncbi:acetyltransferase [Flavobacterium ginsengiterrae]|uniref:PglD N-terminal domain-containing protein n=1 Tax=Flavobacterium ginsengiterrae TaxID=871695 RepID=A0ABP7H1P0_9FLAO
MLIVGAKGFAKEVLEILHKLEQIDNLVFFDDVNIDGPDKLYDKFKILKSIEEVLKYFQNVDNKFCVGIGNPFLRKKMADKFLSLGGIFTSTISPSAVIGSYDIQIGDGCNILSEAILSNSVKIGKGCIVYYNSIITHDCTIGDFVEISPNVTILGRSSVGAFSQIGANATILPNITIGKSVILGAGAVVTKDLPDNCMAVGVPARIVKDIKPLVF